MLFSNKDLIKMSIPLLIQNILAYTIGMIDTMMVASAGDAAVSGVSLVSSLDQMLVVVFSAMTIGGTVVVSQLYGARDLKAAKNGAKQLLYASAFVAIAVTATVQIFRKPLLSALFGDVEAVVMESANGYFFFVSLSFPFLAIQSACESIRRVEGKTTASMIVLGSANLLNVGGNWFLIRVCSLGAAGAAIATLISRAASATVMLVLVSRKENVLQVNRFFHYKPDLPVIRKILRIGIPNGIENGMFNFGRLVTQTLISTMPTAVIAANAVANSLANLQYMPGTTISGVMIPVVGRCVGAHAHDQAKKYASKLTFWTYLCLWAVALATVLLVNPLIGLYDLEGESARLAKQLILYHLAFEVILWPIGFTMPNAFRAAGDVRYTMIVSMVSMWVFRILLAYFLVLDQVSVFGLTVPGFGLGIIGVWMAMSADWIVRGSLFFVHYIRGKWLRKASLVD